jgi:small subunit ribosomal protein S6e
MAKIKLVIGDKSGKTKQVEVEEGNAKSLIGMKLGDTFKGETVDMTGYEFEITGGSDASGFPMRKDVEGSAKKKILIVGGVGSKPKRSGQRTRKMVAGNTVNEKTGQTPLFEEPKAEEEAPAEEKAE